MRLFQRPTQTPHERSKEVAVHVGQVLSDPSRPIEHAQELQDVRDTEAGVADKISR